MFRRRENIAYIEHLLEIKNARAYTAIVYTHEHFGYSLPYMLVTMISVSEGYYRFVS